MIEWGESALITLAILSLVQFLIPFLWDRKFYTQLDDTQTDITALSKIVCFVQYFQFFLISFSFVSLIHAYIVTDLRVFNVVMNTHQEATLLYRITGVWGNHEGSMMLWLWILVLYSAAVARWSSCSAKLKIDTLGIQSCLTFAFSLFILWTSNPFLKASTPYLTGKDLNPILQDPALAFHPPTLYLGLVGFSVVFSFALASLQQAHIERNWIKWARPWALMAWSFLSVGIVMGSWWAYYELGWGGWWFWDPVENASLMPWLTGVALIHTFALVIKAQQGVKWAYCLSIITFLLSLLGTFLVRSGALSSVHSFAHDPERGTFLLAILGISLLCSIVILIRGLKKIDSTPVQKPWSQRAGLIMINNYLLMVLGLVVILGTLYPLILESATGTLITVGPPYYARTFVPFVFVVLIFMAFGYNSSWTCAEATKINLWKPLSLTLSLLIILWWRHGQNLWTLLMLCGAVWMLLATFQHLLQRRKQLSSLSWSMILAHGGLAISILGMSLDTLGKEEKLVGLKTSELVEFQGYTIQLKSVDQHTYPTYEAERATLQLTKDQRQFLLHPEKRYYASHETLTTETALHHTWLSNLYFALGSALPDGRWTLRIYYHPWVELIWLGGLLMALGGAMATVPKLWHKRLWKDNANISCVKILTILMVVSFTSWVHAVDIGERLIDPTLEQRARAISAQLKCPVCVGQSIDDSQAPLAKELRHLVRTCIAQGKSNDEIFALMKAHYGDCVLFEPPFNFETLILWFLPIIAALAGGFCFIYYYKKFKIVK